MGALDSDVQCKLVLLVCVSVLLAACVSLNSRLSSSTAHLCVWVGKNKKWEKYDGGGVDGVDGGGGGR